MIKEISKLFWKTKGIDDPSVLSTEERRVFIEELKAFKDGFEAAMNIVNNSDGIVDIQD